VAAAGATSSGTQLDAWYDKLASHVETKMIPAVK